LAGGVAHDFNNILAGMMMQISLLQAKSHSDPETAEMLREMESEALRASSLTKQLLMFSRRSVLELKPLDLNDVVSNHLKMLGRLIGEHIVVCFNRDAKLPAIEADSAMIEQVLMNLSVNARDAMPNGGRLIISTETVMIDEGQSRAHPDRRPGLFVGLSVIDDGVGMDHETLAQMFEPFFTTKSPGHGTGLGLATVHGIVAQHQGWVEAQSELGKGTTVRVLFPESPRRPAREVKSAALSAAGGNETILLVEDEPTVRRMAGRCLRNLGYRVVDACDGAEATRIWRLLRDEIDMLFTDMVMPEGLSGLDLIRLFRDERPELKTLISSGYSIEMIESGPSSDKTIAYLPKPYDATTLAGAIRKCLDTRSK
jgi:CheY-like chemotaxis protein